MIRRTTKSVQRRGKRKRFIMRERGLLLWQGYDVPKNPPSFLMRVG